MRKIYLSFLAILFTIVSQAQITLYTRTVLSGQTYTPIAGGTVINTNAGLTPGFASGNQDDGGILITLPFTFTYDGIPYTQMSMCTNGWVAVGNQSVISAANSNTLNNFFTTTTPNNTIAAWFKQMGANFPLGSGAMVHGLVGTDVYAFEWRNAVGNGFTDGNANLLNFMVKIYGPNSTNPGRIQLLYGSTTGIISLSCAIGIEDATGGVNHFINAFNGSTTSNTPATAWPGNGAGYQFDPPPPCVAPVAQPTALVLTPLAGSITGTFTAASPVPAGYVVVRTTTNVAPVPVNGTYYTPGNSSIGYIESAGTSTSFTSSFLNSNTQYYYWVFSYSDLCGGGMPFYQVAAPLTSTATTTACSISGTKTVGPTGTYPTLTAAANALVVSGIAGSVVLELEPTYTSAAETYPIVLGYVPCASNTNTITIRPAVGATNLSISGSATTLLEINSGKYWRVDGRPGGVGTTSQLTIANSSITGVAVKFINDAQNNLLNYLDLQGQNTVAPGNGVNTPAGVVFISNTNIANATGNDFNSITNCSVHGTPGFTPAYGIFAFGSNTTVAANNDSITISNNNIYDFFTAGGASTGIKADVGNNAWTISGNSFYQTAPRVTTANNFHRALWITPNLGAANNPASGFVITDNFIGGTAPLAGGGPLTMTGAFPNTFQGMELFVGLGTPTSVQNNTIRNLNISTTSGAGFLGISQGNGHINIGTITGNTIGSSTTNGDITVTTTASGGGTVNGIRAFGTTGSICNIAKNNIAGITTAGTANGVHIQAIAVSGSTTINVTNNTIGSPTVANSINGSSATINNGQGVHGILVNGGSFVNITGNIIVNVNNNYAGTGASGVTRGIALGSSIATISNNLIYNLSNAAPINAAVTGINITSTSGAITTTGNTIHSLVSTSTNTTTLIQVTGIFITGTTTAINTFRNNFIHSFDFIAPNPQGYITGIDNGGGTNLYVNNMIRLGIKADGTSLTNGVTVRGITSLNTSIINNFYHNSIYIGGTGVVTGANPSFAFNRTATSGNYDIRGNIFSNVRSNGTTGGKHYSVTFTTSMAGAVIDNNIYEYSGAGGVFANNGVADVAIYSAGWTPADIHSYAGNPLFVNATGTAATIDLHLMPGTIAEGTGINIPSVTDDFDGQARGGLTPTDIGADAGNFGAPGVDVGASLLVSPLAVGCGSATQSVMVRIRNYSSNPINFVTNPVTVTVAATGPVTYNSNIIVNTGTLAPGATLDVTLPATINTAAAGTYVFNSNTSVTGDVNAANDAMSALNLVITAGGSLSGSYTVGAGGNFITLSAAVAAYNTASCISGDVVFNLTDPLYNAASGEAFPIRIQHINNPGNYTLTIKPAAGVVATIACGTADSAVIKLNGADNIIIDGSNNGTASRDLTIQNPKITSQASGIWVASLGGVGNGAVNNTMKNLVIIGGTSTGLGTQGMYGIVSSANNGMSVANADNDKFTVTNNAISKTMVGISANGTVISQESLLINNNVIGSNIATEIVSARGIEFSYANDANISNNTIFNLMIPSASSSNVSGIFAGVGVIGGKIDKNNVSKIYQPATFVGAQGINISSTAITGLTVSNNMISDIRTSNYSATTTSNATGILISGGTNLKIYNNSVNMSGNITGGTAAGMSSNVMIISTSTTNLDFRNNNLSNTHDFAVNGSVAYNVLMPTGFQFGTINHNNYYGLSTATTTYRVGVGNVSALTPNFPTLNDLRAYTGQDVNSIAVQAPFISPTDGHIDIALGTALDNKGTPLSGITSDIDGDVRNATTPDIGADEYAVVTGIDFGARTLVSPGVKQCYSNAETVSVRIRNYSGNTHNFALIPVTVSTSVTGPNPLVFTPVVVNTGTLAPGDSLVVVISNSYDMSALGSYTFNAFSTVSADVTPANNPMPVVIRTLSATTVGTISAALNQFCLSGTPSLSLTGSNGNTIQWQSAVSATGPWTNVGTNSISFIPSSPITTDAYYRAYIVCNANSDTSIVKTITVNNPQLLSTTPATRCGPGTVTLGATGSAGTSFNWYTSASGGAPSFTGGAFTTPIINNTTTYYVGAVIGGSNSTVGVSPTATNCGTMAATGAVDYPLRFNTTAPVVINSAWVIPQAAITLTVGLRQALSNVNIQTASFTFTAAQIGVPQQINLGWAIATPGNYQLTNIAGGIYRIGSFTCAYPFTSTGGGFSIVGGASFSTSVTDPNQYNGFYGINVSEGCETLRQAVTATVTPTAAFDITNNLTVCNNAITTLQVNSTLADFNTYSWTPVSGLFTNAAATTAYVAGASASTVYEKLTTPGTYTFIAQANNTTTGCQNFDSVKVTVLPAAFTVVPTPDQLCVSGSSTITILPDPNTFGAAQYQWQSSPNNGTYTNIASATGTNYTTPTITATTYYKVDLKNSAGVSCTTAYDTVIVNTPAITNSTPAALCGPGTMTLTAAATPGATINWYTTPAGGSPVFSGSSFTTPNLATTTTYYAAATTGTGGGDVGIKVADFPICGFPATTTATDYPIRFTTTKSIVINTAWVIPTSNSLTVALKAQGSTVNIGTPINFTFTAAQIGVPQQINLGILVSTPGNYQLTNISGSLWRITTLGCGYPFSTPSNSFTITGSAISSTGATATTYYNSFFQLNVSEGCESPRVPVVAQVSPNTAITLQPLPNISTCVGASIKLVVNTVGANVVYQWRKSGANIANSNNDTLILNPVALTDAGTYDVVITGLCGTVTSTIVTVNVSAANTWTGTVSTDWNNPANWCGGVPTPTTDVAIFSGTPYQPVINATLANARNITINAGASILVQPNGTLNLYGDLVNNGNFVASDAFVFFKGATNQNIAGMNVGSIIVNGTSGITLTGGMTVGTTVTLTNGNITLGVNNLTINGNVTGTLASHIVTNSSGSVISKSITSSSVTIPVGPSTTSYNPVTINNGGGRDYAVRVQVGLSPAIANPGRAVNRTWSITPSTAPASPANITFQYEDTHMNTSGVAIDAMEIGVHNGTSWAVAVVSATPSGTPTSRLVAGNFNQFGPMVVTNIGGISWITAASAPVDPTVSSVKLLPNLVETSTVLRVVSTRSAKIRWNVIDGQGRTVMSFDRSVLQGQNDIPLQLQQLAAGMYYLSGTTDKGLTTVVKFVKQ